MASTSSPSARSRASKSDRSLFTSQMQDRQARNKNPYTSDEDSDFDSVGGRYDAYNTDTYAQTQLRRDAAIKLDSPELVMMLAQSRNDSIPATRNYLTKILCGYLTQADIDKETAAEAAKTAAASARVAAGNSERDARGMAGVGGSRLNEVRKEKDRRRRSGGNGGSSLGGNGSNLGGGSGVGV